VLWDRFLRVKGASLDLPDLSRKMGELGADRLRLNRVKTIKVAFEVSQLTLDLRKLRQLFRRRHRTK
jgi:hypothetical protein